MGWCFFFFHYFAVGCWAPVGALRISARARSPRGPRAAARPALLCSALLVEHRCIVEASALPAGANETTRGLREALVSTEERVRGAGPRSGAGAWLCSLRRSIRKEASPLVGSPLVGSLPEARRLPRRRAPRALRAPVRGPGLRLGHQLLRPVGRRARQGPREGRDQPHRGPGHVVPAPPVHGGPHRAVQGRASRGGLGLSLIHI